MKTPFKVLPLPEINYVALPIFCFLGATFKLKFEFLKP
jgi:hypothetical protein